MKCMKQLTTFVGRWHVLNHHDDEPASVPSPILASSIVCFIALVFNYWITRRAVSRLEVWWAELLVYALVPLFVTFVVLYRSSWHPHLAGAARTLSLILLSFFVSGAVLIATGLGLLLASVVYYSIFYDIARFKD